jgi:HAD superfamily hydrolase (TIGR01549 family)
MTSPRPLLRGVVFDMDGTLTIPNLDFGEMYRRCGVEGSKDILAEIRNSMSPDQASEANAIIEEMEEEGRRTLQLMPGALELTHWLQAHKIPTALVTRNTKRSAQVLQDKLLKHYHFDVVISRDDNDHAPKPDPASMRYIASQWNLELPNESILMVGDSPANDIIYGKSAGVKTALLDTGRRFLETANGKSDGAMGADMIVDHLGDLPSHLWSAFEIEGALGSTAQGLHGQPAPTPTHSLTMAAANGDLATMEKLLLEEKKNSNINNPDESGNTALIWAAEMGHFHVVDRLLQLTDMHVDARGYLGATATCRAARRGHVQVLQRLAEAGANLDIPNDKLQYPLHFAAFKQNQDAVKVLLQHGANTLSVDRKGKFKFSCQITNSTLLLDLTC